MPTSPDLDSLEAIAMLLETLSPADGDVTFTLWTGPEPRQLVVPLSVAHSFAQVLRAHAENEAVTIVYDDAELTTQQAADYLNVSRPYLIKMLETGVLPFRKVGIKRRVKFADLREYRDSERARIAPALEELSQIGQEIEESILTRHRSSRAR